MALPNERLADATRGAATRALLRLVAVWLACGALDLARGGSCFLIATAMEPGDGSGALAIITHLYGSRMGGEAWAGAFLLVTTALVIVEAAALVWAVRREREDPPLILLAAGLTGLVARGLAYGASITTTMLVGERGTEALASYSIASSIAGSAGFVLELLLGLAILIVLFVRAIAPRAERSREGPYREPA